MKVVIVDDDKLVTLSLKTILESGGEVEVLEMGKNGAEAIELFEKHKPDVLLMDIRMDTMTGIEAAKEIIKKHREAKILFLTTFLDDEYIIQALHIGAKGYILKQDFESILPAVKAVFSGQSVFGNEIVLKIPNLLNSSPKKDYSVFGISDKEYEIIQAVARGLSNKEIAEELFLSEGTVRNYLSNILDKLNLRDRTQLAVFYYQNQKHF
ncbi:response regulator transcription factor [Konateibacter massiliensis]|uniref:response regulator transcription factor n=1 Tax=Konateibacter massiliensis TaxID=2002841 RepID=UPI000C1529DB|nr:response regulator transcription factor [Konateibacter massiliensis]